MSKSDTEPKKQQKASAEPLYLYVFFDENQQNHKSMRIFDCPKLQITICSRGCPYCSALKKATTSLPESWQKKMTVRKTDASECAQLHSVETDEWIKLRNRSNDERIMRNAVSNKFKPKKQHFSPQSHQQDLLRCIQAGQKHLLVAWDMGSGKTAGSGYALTHHDRVAVVCEKTLIDYWVEAFTEMGVRPAVPVWSVNIMSYETVAKGLHANSKLLAKTAVVIDEVQHYKNFYSATGADLPTVVDAMARVALSQMPLLLLTGTAIQNNALDVKYLLYILAPQSKITKHMQNIKDSSREEVSNVMMPTIVKNYKGGLGTFYRDFYDALKSKVHYFSPAVYEHKTFRKHYPVLDEQSPIRVKLTWEQCLEYFYNSDGMHIDINGLGISSAAAKGGVMRQLAVTSSAVVCDGYYSSKTDAIVKSIAAHPNTKHVVYSGLKERSLKPVRDLLQQDYPNLRVALLDGTVVGDGVRQKMMQDYINGKLDVLLICRVGAVGLDLRGTSAIHLMESQINTPTEKQIFARAIRFSVKKPEPGIVEAKRYIGTFPDPKDPVSAATHRVIDEWLRSQRPDIRDAFGKNSKGVITWINKRIQDRKITMDEHQYASNVAKYLEICPLIYLIHAASCYKLLDSQTRQLPQLFLGKQLQLEAPKTKKAAKKPPLVANAKEGSVETASSKNKTKKPKKENSSPPAPKKAASGARKTQNKRTKSAPGPPAVSSTSNKTKKPEITTTYSTKEKPEVKKPTPGKKTTEGKKQSPARKRPPKSAPTKQKASPKTKTTDAAADVPGKPKNPLKRKRPATAQPLPPRKRK